MYKEYKKIIRNVIQLLINQDYTPQEIFNILKFNNLEVLEVELIQKQEKNRIISNQLSLIF